MAPDTGHGRRYVPAPTFEMTEGALAIARERADQMSLKGWTPEHDDEHANGELRDAAIAYAMFCDDRAGENAQDVWPWDESWWNPGDNAIRTLEKAGALIAAEIDRLIRKRPLGPRSTPRSDGPVSRAESTPSRGDK